MRLSIAACLTSCLLASCQHSPVEIVVEKPVAAVSTVTAEDCPVNYGDKSIGAALEGLSAALNCERSNNAAERVWREKMEHPK